MVGLHSLANNGGGKGMMMSGIEVNNVELNFWKNKMSNLLEIIKKFIMWVIK